MDWLIDFYNWRIVSQYTGQFATGLANTLIAAGASLVLSVLAGPLGVQHAMVLMLDAPAGRLYTVASHGYASSGVGSEVLLGHGVIGVAARENTPVRISHVTHAASYSHAVRAALRTRGGLSELARRAVDFRDKGLELCARICRPRSQRAERQQCRNGGRRDGDSPRTT